MAAGMDARGYGRAGTASTAQRRRTGALMLLGLVGSVRRHVRRARPDRAPLSRRCRCWRAAWSWPVSGFVSAGSPRAAHALPTRSVALARGRGGVRGLVAAYVGWLLSRQQLAIAYPPSRRRAAASAWPPCSASRPPWGGALCAPAAGTPRWCRVIELRGITFRYDDAAVLDGVDLVLEEGELVLVSGPHRRRQVDAARRRHRPGAALHRRARWPATSCSTASAS